MKKVFLANFESRSFSFNACGETRQQAIDALVKGLEAHTKAFNLESDWFSIDSDIGCMEMQIGCAYRDYSLIKSEC